MRPYLHFRLLGFKPPGVSAAAIGAPWMWFAYNAYFWPLVLSCTSEPLNPFLPDIMRETLLL